MKEKVQYETLEEVKKSPHEARTFEEVLKFNPYHGYHGYFSSANAAGAKASLRGKTENGQRLLDQYKENHGGKASGGSSSQKPKEYQKLTQEDAKELAKEMGQDNIDQAEVDQMISHGGGEGGYFSTPNSWDINEVLREGWDPYDEEQSNAFTDDDLTTIKTLDKNMKPSTRDIEIYRKIGNSFYDKFGISLDNDSIEEIQEKTLGKIYDNKGYTSTSFDMKENVFKYYPVQLNIKAPKGTPMLVSPDRDSWDGTIDEAEILLARNTAMKITGIKPVYADFGDIQLLSGLDVDLEVLLD